MSLNACLTLMLHDDAGLTELLPRWLAPNLITLTGTFGLILAYCVSLYYVPTFTGELHSAIRCRPPSMQNAGMPAQ